MDMVHKPGQEAKPVTATGRLPRREDRAWLSEIRSIHQDYQNGLVKLYDRIRSNEEWWRLHSDDEERKQTEIGIDGGFVAKSAWLPNVVISKHADGMDAYPESTIQPREPGDRQTAETLSKVVSCILELGGFRRCWDRLKLRKLKHGAGIYKVIWDPAAHNGLGEVATLCVNPLNLAWQPTCSDIQKSPYFFHQEYVDKAALAARYPDAAENLKAAELVPSFQTGDEYLDKTKVTTVVECYYKTSVPSGIRGVSRTVLHYVVYTGDVVLYASEDDPKMAQGWYHHGKYPYVFDVLFPEEDSAFGRGYIDLGKNAQTQIDLLNTAFIKNAMAGALPRWLASNDIKINIADLLDTGKAVIPVSGSVSEEMLRQVEHKPLDGNYLNLRESLVQEIRETTGNTESATGATPSGVTAASAIAALQEASGKISRDENSASYAAFADVVRMIIELVRQFYTLPRTFRITGSNGQEEFISFDNSAIAPQRMVGPDGADAGLSRPEFDVIVGAQRASPYTRMAQNELALQFYDKGFFDPARAEQAMMCLEMMDFQGKEELLGKIRQQATMHSAMLQFAQLAMQYAPPQAQPVIAQMVMQVSGQGQAAPAIPGGGAVPGTSGGEPKHMAAARQQAQERAIPMGG